MSGNDNENPAGLGVDLKSETSPKNPPPLPSRPAVASSGPLHRTNTNTAQLLIFRQSEIYSSQAMLLPVDVFLNSALDIPKKITDSLSDDDYWVAVAQSYGGSFIRDHDLQHLEKKILEGIPEELRGVIYLKVLQVKSTIDGKSYESLLKKAKLSDFTDGSSTPDYPEGQRDLLQVYQFCIRETLQPNTQIHSPSIWNVIKRLAPVLSSIESLSEQEQLALLFKFTSLASCTSKELSYKGSRSLEELASKQFLHIVKQGIELASLFDSFFLRALESISDRRVLLMLLDFVLFEGEDYFIRLICAIFNQLESKLLSLNGDELQSFLYSDEFMANVSHERIAESITVEIELVKYENEFNLMNANAISGNDNELSNLSEMNHELEQKLQDLQEKLTSLRKTHEEIYKQNSDFFAKREEAEAEKKKLSEKKLMLEEQYAQLTMQENLSNTIKANEDISRANQDFESQIEDLKKKVEKKSKLIK